jgi:hypothetical protein
MVVCADLKQHVGSHLRQNRFEQGRRGPLDIAPEAPELALKVMAEMLLGERFALEHYARMAELYHVLCLGLFTAPLNLPFTRFGESITTGLE